MNERAGAAPMTGRRAADVTWRAATDLDDLRLVGELLTKAWLAGARHVAWTPGDLSWWFAQAWPTELSAHLRLWSLDGRVVAWSWHEIANAEGPAELEYHVWSGDTAVDANVERAIVETALEGSSLEIWAMDTDVARLRVLAETGFAALTPRTPGASNHLVASQYRRELDGPIASDDVPAGYRIRSLAGAHEIPKRVAVHRAAFAPSRMVAEKYERLITLPLYRFEDDLVVEAPDGTFAAFTMAWWDPVARVGEFEPVGTHPDHQRRGLGKALLSHALHRYRDMGARLAQVFSSADNVASEALYRSVGFERQSLHIRYRRPG